MIDSLTLTNTVTGVKVIIDQDTSSYVLTEADLGQVDSSHNSYKYPNQVGVYYSSTTLETRDVSIEGWVIGNTYAEIKQRKAVLNKLVNPREKLRLVRNGYKLEFYPDSSIQYSPDISKNNTFMCYFLIQGEAAYPLFSTENDSNHPITLTVPKFHFPLIIPKSSGVIMGVKQRSLVARIDNTGDIQTGIRFVLEAVGAVKNPSITEINSQSHIWIDKAMVAGEVITISTEDGNKYVKGKIGNTESNYFKYRRLDSEWIQMRVGTNIFQYDCEEGKENLNVTIQYSPKYLEVD